MAKKGKSLETPKFTKSQLLKSNKYSKRRDLLNVILKEELYSIEEVNSLIESFMKGKVN